MDLDRASNPIFAGNTSSRPRAWMLVPEHGFRPAPQVLLENEGLEGLLDGQIPPDLLEYWADRSAGGAAGIGHLAVDLERVVHEGLEAVLAELDTYDTELDPSRREYRRAMGFSRPYAARPSPPAASNWLRPPRRCALASRGWAFPRASATFSTIWLPTSTDPMPQA